MFPGDVHLDRGAYVRRRVVEDRDIVITIATSTGHLAIWQTVTAVSPIPSGRGDSFTIGPVRISASTTTARISMISVTSIWSGRSFQIGRPSGVS